MISFFRMLEQHGLALSDAEADGYDELSRAAKRCLSCIDKNACIRWLKWRGRYGRSPLCPSAGYFAQLKGRFRPD